MNTINRIRYVLMNRLGIKGKPKIHLDCEPLIRDNFSASGYWSTMYPSTITYSRNRGATLSMQIANKTGFVCPAIVSHSAITYGNVSAVIENNFHSDLINTFVLRYNKSEWGFKITDRKITIVFPFGSAHCKLYRPMQPHKFTIDFDASTNKIYWRIDNIKVYEMDDTVTVDKRIVISLTSKTNKFHAKELPQSMMIKNVDANIYDTANERKK